MYVISRNIVRFLVVILFQVLVMDNVMINGYMIPYIYILFILLMPFETPRWTQLVLGFLLGMGIDLRIRRYQAVGIAGLTLSLTVLSQPASFSQSWLLFGVGWMAILTVSGLWAVRQSVLNLAESPSE